MRAALARTPYDLLLPSIRARLAEYESLNCWTIEEADPAYLRRSIMQRETVANSITRGPTIALKGPLVTPYAVHRALQEQQHCGMNATRPNKFLSIGSTLPRLAVN